MAVTKTAVVIGVGPLAGLGGALCQRAASEGLHVFVAGRTQAVSYTHLTLPTTPYV